MKKELIDDLAKRDISAISMEMIPRSTLAQKMDALSSQANLAGYAAVTMATDRMRKILPMMMTPSGTISPARFFIIGVGVAGRTSHRHRETPRCARRSLRHTPRCRRAG